MVFEPTQRDEIQESIRDRLTSGVTALSNFVSTSFNQVFLEAFADELYEYEVRLLAAQLSGWVDYAGGPITEDDLNRLGLQEFTDAETVNQYMEDFHLDNIGALVGVARNRGSQSTGTVVVDVFDSTTRVPDGMEVSTPPSVDGDQQIFEVDLGDDDYVTPNEQNRTDSVEVGVIATERGSEYNVGSDSITRLRSPPPGVEGVTNPAATSGGEDAETNDEYRSRIKNAVFETSGGGTAEGIRGFIINNVEGVNDVFIDEFFTESPIYVDVIVDGGVLSEVETAVEQARPAGVRHNVVRPVNYNVGVLIEVSGTDIDELQIKNEVEDYIFSLDLGEDFIEDRITQRVLNIEPDVDNILAINLRIINVVDYRDEYDGSATYSLPESPLGRIEDEERYYSPNKTVYELQSNPIDTASFSVDAVVNGSTQTVSDTEYDLIDDDGDGMVDSIDWAAGSVVPDDGTIFTMSYDMKIDASESFTYEDDSDVELTYKPALPGGSVVSDGTTTYELGVDYDIVDADGDGDGDSLRWLSGGSTPSSGDTVTVDYEIGVGSIERVEGVLGGTEDTVFVEGTDYDEFDSTSDGYTDSIEWLAGDTPDAGTEFTVDFSVEHDVDGDYVLADREKMNPVVDGVRVESYE